MEFVLINSHFYKEYMELNHSSCIVIFFTSTNSGLHPHKGSILLVMLMRLEYDYLWKLWSLQLCLSRDNYFYMCFPYLAFDVIMQRGNLAVIFLFFCALLFSVLSIQDFNVTENELVYVDGGSLVSLHSANPLSGQQRMDLLESTLYAQLNASQQFDREDNLVGWYERYTYILQDLGWNISKPQFRVLKKENRINWKDAIESIFDQELVQSEKGSLDHILLSYLRLPASTSSVKIFDQLSTKGDISTFQVILASLNGEKELVASFGLFDIIELKSTDVNSQATGILYSINSGVLDMSVYKKHCDVVELYLADIVEKYIFSLKI